MEHRLKQLINRLGRAIDESLSESQTIAEVISEIKREGYDVRSSSACPRGDHRIQSTITRCRSKQKAATVTHKDLDSSLTEQDQKFLKAMSIRLEE